MPKDNRWFLFIPATTVVGLNPKVCLVRAMFFEDLVGDQSDVERSPH
jgi:hypothetical protein